MGVVKIEQNHNIKGNISVIVQGPVIWGKTDNPRDDVTKRSLETIRQVLPKAEIILSTWEGTNTEGLDFDKVIYSKDPGGTRFYYRSENPSIIMNNVNRQIISTLEGIKSATNDYVVKMRSDAFLVDDKFIDGFTRFTSRSDEFKYFKERIVVSSVFTRSNVTGLLFHPSDIFQFGLREDMLKLWDVPLSEEPKNTRWFENRPRPKPDLYPMDSIRYFPEQYIWVSFLRKYLNVPFEFYSEVSSYLLKLSEKALVNNFVVMNPWQLGIQVDKFDQILQHNYSRWNTMYSFTQWQYLYRQYCEEENKQSSFQPEEIYQESLFRDIGMKVNKKLNVAVLWPISISDIDAEIVRQTNEKWLYYSLCLQSVANLKYYSLSNWDKIIDFDYVYVHEYAYEYFKDRIENIITHLKQNNHKLIWLELHNKITYSGAIFIKGLVSNLDSIYKSQILPFSKIKSVLRGEAAGVLPYFYYRHGSFEEYLKDRSRSSYEITDELLDNHLTIDSHELEKKVKPFLTIFSPYFIQKGLHKRAHTIFEKEKGISILEDWRYDNALINVIAGSLKKHGSILHAIDEYGKYIKEYKYHLAIGDYWPTSRFCDSFVTGSIPIHYDSEPFILPEEFRAYETYIPIGKSNEIFLEGGSGVNIDYLDSMNKKIIENLQDEELAGRILDNHKKIVDTLLAPELVVQKIGITYDDIQKQNEWFKTIDKEELFNGIGYMRPPFNEDMLKRSTEVQAAYLTQYLDRIPPLRSGTIDFVPFEIQWSGENLIVIMVVRNGTDSHLNLMGVNVTIRDAVGAEVAATQFNIQNQYATPGNSALHSFVFGPNTIRTKSADLSAWYAEIYVPGVSKNEGMEITSAIKEIQVSK